MRVKSLVIGYVFALALFLFAQRHPSPARPSEFHGVVDLTYPTNEESVAIPVSDGKRGMRQPLATRLDAPATLSKTLWTVDQIPAERLVAPLVVLDVRNNVKSDADYQVSVTDIARWEHMHGEIPVGAVVMALTGSGNKPSSAFQDATLHSAGYSADAAKFLVEGRDAVGLGIDSRSVDSGASRGRSVYNYSLSRSAYVLENVARLERAPSAGGIVMVGPAKLQNSANAPVRILALAR
jgi:kynurenine formamidase